MGYLVINRRIGELVKIKSKDHEIEILVVDFDRGYLTIGIDAPKDFEISRPPTKVEEEYGHRSKNYGQYRRRKSIPDED